MSDATSLTVEWVDAGRDPVCEPNPAYPKGKDLDVSNGAERSCSTTLPYPAKRCGHFIVSCLACRLKAIVTTAGRIDDPRSIRVACRAKGMH